MAETSTYTYIDIARYLQHKMSPQEMHAFEKALMNDPFLADAMEGFSASNAKLTDVHLTDIEQQVTGQKERMKIVPLAAGRTSWWKVAAIGLIVIAGGLGSFLLLSRNDERSLAQQVPVNNSKEIARPPGNPIPADESAVSPESPRNAGVSALQPDSSVDKMSSSRPKPASSGFSRRDADTAAIALRRRIPGVSITDSQAAAPVLMNKAARPDEAARASSAPVLNEFKGKVTGNSGEPLAFATVTDNRTRTGVSADAEGYFALKNPDSVLKVTVNIIGYSSLQTTISSSKMMNNITLEKSSQALSEVLITANGSSREKRKNGSESGSFPAAEPVGGWDSFRQYLNTQVDSLQAHDAAHVYSSEDVELEFSVDSKGHPFKIKVMGNTSRPAAGKAVEILVNGPKWIKKKNRRVKVMIPFGSAN